MLREHDCSALIECDVVLSRGASPLPCVAIAYRRFLADELAVVLAKLEVKRQATEKYYEGE